MVKVYAKQEAIRLRKEGHSYNYIAAKVGVSKSTLGVWLADIPYTPNAETIERIGKALAASGAVKSEIKRKSIQQAREEAVSDLGRCTSRDLFMVGLGLYIGEGVKSSQMISFANSNPAIINLIIRWFTQTLNVNKENIRIRLHIYPDCGVTESIVFWSDITGISESQFLKPIIDRRLNKTAIRSGKLPYGTAHVRINSLGEKKFGVFLARKIMAWSDLVLNTQNLRV